MEEKHQGVYLTSLTSAGITMNGPDVSHSLKRRGRTGLEKGLFCLTVVLVAAVIGLIIGLVLEIKNKDDSQVICLTDECARAATRVLDAMDQTVDPCEDFFTYACGNWIKRHVIPEDRNLISVFEVLRDEVQVTAKNLYEDPNNCKNDERAWRTAKDMYASCINTDLIEQKNISVVLPLMQELGGWPVLGSNPGGNWNASEFDMVKLLITLKKYNNDPIMEMSVGPDSRNSTQKIISLDQSDFVLPGRNYYLYPTPRFQAMREAYVTFASSVAVLFGANAQAAKKEMEEILAFETEIANITMRQEDRRDSEALYNRMAIAELKTNITEPKRTDPIQFDWYKYVSGIMGLEGVEIKINETEPVVVRAVPYFKKLMNVLQKYPKRTIANYMVWVIMQHRVNNLPRRFLDLRNDYNKVVYGQPRATARWRECESYVTYQMRMAIGQKFVKKEFDESAKDTALEMIGNIRAVFSQILSEADWMDDHTKNLAKEKADAIRNWIGFPNDILNTSHLNELYENVTADKNEYFQNVLHNLKRWGIGGLKYIREPYEKNSWTTPPTDVNAFYSSTLNNIMFPAGILQPPFYAKGQPKSMNYGGIGVVIGHEITHGFDDRGRQFNKDGDLEQWWDQKIINQFKQKAQCIVDQYSNFFVPEANMTVNGINTQGENIADNGGLKESYRAYRRWVEQQGKEEPKLPGLDLSHNQLFFLSFGQVYCGNSRKEAAIGSVQTDPHSPKQFRVIGTLQNSPDFARAYNCPRNSRMNPDKKCSVW